MGCSSRGDAPPDVGPITPENPGDAPHLPPTRTHLERLRDPWNSNNRADWPVAETLAELSSTAYLPPVDAVRRFGELGFNQVMPVVQGSMIAYVVSGEDVTVIAFRGTDFAEVSDWIANLNRTPLTVEEGLIHRGFFRSYESMKPQIEQILRSRQSGHLWLTGHSLGGALALSCAYDYAAREHRPIDGLITFGQPMLANPALSKYLNEQYPDRYARFVNRDDVVPRIPPQLSPLRFTRLVHRLGTDALCSEQSIDSGRDRSGEQHRGRVRRDRAAV
ncbi:MAG: lipase family protein [Planctomycetaceae bacterium]|nr:lipase family protein [Planctomycetaceae bacterium]